MCSWAYRFGFAAFILLAMAPAAQAADDDAPRYVNDSSWPKPFAHHWVMGQIGGLTVDGHDRIWVLQRALSYAVDEQGVKHDLAPADRMPAVMVFDREGNIVKSWGGQGHVPDWPKSEHGLWVDKGGNVWIGGNAPGDRQVLKFTADGRQLLEIGRPTSAPRDNADTSMLGEPAGIEVDDAAHEVYIADGYFNSRVVVYDSDTGKFKRGWGAYGIGLDKIANPPEPTGDAASTPGRYVAEGPAYVPGETPEKQFRTPVHCVHQSVDRLIYVCDRRNDRIQIFTRQGKFVKEFLVHRETRGNGSVWTLSFSHDPQHLPEFLRAIQAADLVLGSRYREGKVTVVNWPIARPISLFWAPAAPASAARLWRSLRASRCRGSARCGRRRACTSSTIWTPTLTRSC